MILGLQTGISRTTGRIPRTPSYSLYCRAIWVVWAGRTLKMWEPTPNMGFHTISSAALFPLPHHPSVSSSKNIRTSAPFETLSWSEDMSSSPCAHGVEVFGLPWWLSDKESTCYEGDSSSIPQSGTSPGEGNDNPLQYSCLENPRDRGAWQAIVHGVTESDMTEWALKNTFSGFGNWESHCGDYDVCLIS